MQITRTDAHQGETRAAAATNMNHRARPLWLPAALLLFSTILVFWPATGHDFVNYDDPFYVTKNPEVQGGLTWLGVKWVFTNIVVGNWHPLTLLSHMLDCQLFGLKPWGHHLGNLLLHGANTVLVFLLFCRLTGAICRSLMVAALFGLHPLHVESVAWVAERKDVLSTFFGLLCLIAYARYVQGKRESSSSSSRAAPKPGEGGSSSPFLKSPVYWLSFLFFTLGLMSKPMLVTIPFAMLLLDYWPLQRFIASGAATASTFLPRHSEATAGQRFNASTFAPLLIEKIPFFFIAAVMSVVTCVVQQHSGMMDSLESVPFGVRAENALISYCRYLEKLFWPARLAVFYPYPKHWAFYQALLAAGALALITAMACALRARRPWLLTGWFWFCGTLVPVIGLVQVGGQAMADRYTYLPSLGFFVLIVWGAAEAAISWRYRAMTLSVAGSAAVVACIVLTRQQLGYWQDSETLYRHALAVTENNYLAHHNLGIFLFSKGRTDEAIVQYREALRVQPDSDMAHYNLGAALGKKGETDEAMIEFQKALNLNPDNADAHINLGTAFAMKGRMDEAMAQVQEALRLQPRNAEAHYYLGAIFGREGRLDEAIAQFQEAIRLQPDFTAARLNLAHAMELKNASGR